MKSPRSKPAARVQLVVEDPQWRKADSNLSGDLRRAALAALTHAPHGEQRAQSLTILLADDARLAALNARFRGRDKPTNVLSFPAVATASGYLGDVAIAYGVAAREAREAGKTLRDHGVHLAVHGVLHLLGYDHETAREARIMEPLEITILAELGIADPYAARPVAALD